MTHLPDARFADDADPALKHRLQEQQRENTLHVGSHPRILHELCMHVEFVEHCRFILNVLIDCIHTGVEDILDGFVRKVKARGNVDNRCIVVAEPAAARTAAPPAGAASSAMDVDDDDSYVVYRPSTQAGIPWT
ncbi:unnamed protein product, partial [Symbiodinium microadriaticum]